MSTISQLWLPILVTAALIFVASSLIHMVFKWHNSSYQGFANEDAVRAAIGASAPLPGQYILPHCLDMKAMQSDAMQRKFIEGPIAFVTLRKNGPPTMGSSLAFWFLYCVVIAAIAGAIAAYAFGMNASPNRTGHIVGAVCLLAFSGGSIQQGIWMGKPWNSVAKEVLDGFIYACIAAATFTWLWP